LVRPPSVKSSLIPDDVLEDVERESLDAYEAQKLEAQKLEAQKLEAQKLEAPESQEATTAPTRLPDDIVDVPIFAEVDARPDDIIPTLVRVELFKDVPAERLEPLSRGARVLEIPGGEWVFREGEAARSIFVVEHGAVALSGRADGSSHRSARPYEVLGLLGLFSAHSRGQSARAIEACRLLEIDAERIQELLDADAAFHQRVLQLFQTRLIDAFLSNGAFVDVDSTLKSKLKTRFVSRALKANDALLAPGEVGNMLVLVTHGVLTLEERARPGEQPHAVDVSAGQFLAVFGAFAGVPSRARIVATQSAEVLVLSQKDLNELTLSHPLLRTVPQRFGSTARQLTPHVYCADIDV
jgi:CRP-like cAMP-binding protein